MQASLYSVPSWSTTLHNYSLSLSLSLSVPYSSVATAVCPPLNGGSPDRESGGGKTELPSTAVETVGPPLNYDVIIDFSFPSSSLLPSLPPSLPAVETQFIDYRFLKDLEIRKDPKCCCCCVGTELLVYADDKDAVS